MTARIVCFIVVAICAESLDANVSDQGRELAEIHARINLITQNVEQIRSKKDQLSNELSNIEQQYGKVARSLVEFRNKANEKQLQLRQIREDINRQQTQIKEQNRDLQGLVRAAHAMGNREKLKLIFNQQDTVRSSRILIYYNYFNNDRLAKLETIEQSLAKLNVLEVKQQQEMQSLNMTILQTERNKATLAAIKINRKSLLVKLDRDYSEKKQQLNRLKLSEKRLQTLIASLQNVIDDFPLNTDPVPPFSKLKGKLFWPLKGKLVKKFGSKRVNSHWDGVLLAANEGEEIHVVSRGRVVYASWLRGYGLLLIIDHGEEYMTLYAFNQSLYKEVGDWVDAGDVIATVGKSGGRNQAGLYFGIRKKGRPVDPANWCKKLKRGRTG